MVASCRGRGLRGSVVVLWIGADNEPRLTTENTEDTEQDGSSARLAFLHQQMIGVWIGYWSREKRRSAGGRNCLQRLNLGVDAGCPAQRARLRGAGRAMDDR